MIAPTVQPGTPSYRSIFHKFTFHPVKADVPSVLPSGPAMHMAMRVLGVPQVCKAQGAWLCRAPRARVAKLQYWILVTSPLKANGPR